METSQLQRLGLTESDIKIYLALLKIGSANVTQLAEESGVTQQILPLVPVC